MAARILQRVILPFLPENRRLPFRYRLHFFKGTGEAELQHLPHIVQDHTVAIDVGANLGLFSYNMSRHFSKVYSFEINDELTKELRAYNPGNIEIVNKGLSSETASVILYIPLLNGLPLLGWASLTPNNCPDTKEHVEKRVEVCSLDDYNLSSVSLIKIDVEGHEVEVLKGATKTLVRNRPLVIIEVRDQNCDEVFSFFAKHNYRQTGLKNLIGKPGSEDNSIFVPEEKLLL